MKRIGNDGERGSEQHGRADALHRTRQVEQRGRRRQPAAERRQKEHGEAEQQHALAAEAISQTACRQQARRERDHIGADDPFDVGEARVKRARDRRQGNGHHVGVEDDQRTGGRGRGEDETRVGGAARRWKRDGFICGVSAPLVANLGHGVTGLERDWHQSSGASIACH